jgi:hypothetical protein
MSKAVITKPLLNLLRNVIQRMSANMLDKLSHQQKVLADGQVVSIRDFKATHPPLLKSHPSLSKVP